MTPEELAVYESAIALFPFRVGQAWMYNTAYQGSCLEKVTVTCIEFAITEQGVRPVVFIRKGNHRPMPAGDIARFVALVEEVAA